ncbi:glycosyltransferase [Microvirga sp. KLBC 81]|uniref:glycosyltransferase n=1 Tax=Microvirga sp. KLBC 81 TaxID=1862707 RepID=UPI000D52194A|nr:glycosyltransferase [Microvirga sp. KLBC 81]PVE20960.1 glycosyltransferase [Microvirga sp. KLBC 81]
MTAGAPLAVEMVLPSLETGGMETMTAALAQALAARGHRVGVTCLQKEGELAEGLRRAGIPVALVPCPGTAPILRPHPGLCHHFAARAPDVVHAQNGVWAKAALAARAADVPAVIHTAHGFSLNEPWFGDALRWWAGLRTDMVVAVSASLREHLVRRARIPASRVVTIINGIDTARFAPSGRSGILREALGIGPDVPLLGCVARLDPVKNHALLLEAMALLVRQVPDARLVLVGDGPLREALQERAEALGLGGKVLFAGTLADTAPAYRDLDLFVLPSVSEGTSISVLEAMASGIPVVATAVGGTPQLLDGGTCGTLVPSGDPAAMAEAIRRLLTDPVGRTRMARAARERVLEEFGHAAMVRAYEKLYRQVAGKSASLIRREA